MLDRLIEETAADAGARLQREMRRCQAIAAAGTSADAQLAVYEAHRKDRDRDKRAAGRHRLDRERYAA